MVRRRFLRSFMRDESGLSLVEALLTFPIVMLIFAAFVEFGYAMFQWNQTVKALQYGARLAAVSDPLVATFDPVTAAAAPEIADVGNSMPVGWGTSCEGNECNTELNRIVYGSSAATSCQPLGTAGVRPAMCHLNPRIGKSNVIVTYELSGLGYYGRPNGAVVTIRMALVTDPDSDRVTFDLPILGGLLGLDQVTIPALPVTITSEDLSTSSS